MSPSISAPSPRRRKPVLPSSDPLTLALQPPPNETASEKHARLLAEKHAKQRSDDIDRLLKQHADDAVRCGIPPIPSSSSSVAGSKKGRVYKMVLLGQAGAGKTTVLKQMRLLYDPQAHERERRGWGRIVVLNLVASVRVVLETMAVYGEQRRAGRKSVGGEEAAVEAEDSTVKKEKGGEGRERKALELDGHSVDADASGVGGWSKYLPEVVRLERALRSELGAFGEEVVLSGSDTVTTTSGKEAAARPSGSSDRSPLLLRPGWQERLFTYARRSLSLASSSTSTPSGLATNLPSDIATSPAIPDDNDEALHLLRRIQPAILALWNDNPQCRTLRRRGLFLDGQCDAATTYFLDAYPRITSPAFHPTDDDIMHSRVRTLGITEDTFRVDRSLVYRIYDVGGSRSQRAAWASFFDDAESVIFMAPLSAFDQPLVEDPATNRLADTFSLFSQVVANPLLRGASVILFLNKIDLLEKKLRQGVKLHRFWPEYGGDNDFEAVWRWFRAKFRDCLRRAEDELGDGARRRLYVHTTVATSTVQIRAILMSVKDSILRENLRVTGLVG